MYLYFTATTEGNDVNRCADRSGRISVHFNLMSTDICSFLLINDVTLEILCIDVQYSLTITL